MPSSQIPWTFRWPYRGKLISPAFRTPEFLLPGSALRGILTGIVFLFAVILTAGIAKRSEGAWWTLRKDPELSIMKLLPW